jgi:hypothetical protein
MKDYSVNIWDRAFYLIGANSLKEAEEIAMEYFNERKPHILSTVTKDIEKDSEDIFDYLYSIIEHRAEDENRTIGVRCAYESVLSMLHYALRNDWNALQNFDERTE